MKMNISFNIGAISAEPNVIRGEGEHSFALPEGKFEFEGGNGTLELEYTIEEFLALLKSGEVTLDQIFKFFGGDFGSLMKNLKNKGDTERQTASERVKEFKRKYNA